MSVDPLSIIIHGGAGRASAEAAQKKLPYLNEALEAGWALLKVGQRGEKAVEAALRIMEGSEFFNAGYGGYPNANGIVLLDVGLMNGEREFVSVVNIRRLKYPSSVALELMKRHKALMTVWTYELEKEIDASSEELKERLGWVATHGDLIAPSVRLLMKNKELAEVSSHGTIGCVVRDSKGRLTAGTSTGGINLKTNGRIGDTPIIGAGVYADNDVCALSTTGHGESFLRSMISGYVIAEFRHQLRNDPEYFRKSADSAHAIMSAELREMEGTTGGKGAMIMIPRKGKPCFSFNSEMVSVAFRSGGETFIEESDALISFQDGRMLR